MSCTPAWMRDADEFPHTPAPMPGWSENYFSVCYSLETGIGAWLHLRHDPGGHDHDGFWEEMVVICLPDGSFLATKGFSSGRVDTSPSGAEISCCGLSFCCDEPYRSWRYRFDGPARALSREEMWRGPLADGPYVPTSLVLEARNLGPPFDYGEKLSQSWASAHYDQHMRMVGVLRCHGRTLEIDGLGMRDHSWGPRDWGKLARHAWIHGQFPRSGRAFTIVDIEGRPEYPEHQMRRSILIEGESARRTEASGWPLGTGGHDMAVDFDLKVGNVEGGTIARVEILNSWPMMLLSGPEIGIGAGAGVKSATHDYVVSFAKATWGDENGVVYTERTRRFDPGR